MKKEDILTVGTTVYLGGNVKQVMIVGRSVLTEIDNKKTYFDYAGCLFPEGLVDDQLVHFNHEDITKVIHKGEVVEGEELLQDLIMEASQENEAFKFKIDRNNEGEW